MKFRAIPVFLLLGLLCAAPVFAQKDTLVATPTSPSLGDVTGGSVVSQTIDYAVVVPQNACNGNACTQYPRTVNFTVTSPGTIASGSTCVLTGRSSTCSVTVNITAPPADPVSDKPYSVTLTGSDAVPGNRAIEMVPSNGVVISFTVPKSVPALIKTQLDLQDACGVLHGNDVVLKALLTTGTNPPVPVSGRQIVFTVNGVTQSAYVTTDQYGYATLPNIPVAAFPVGPDIPITAVFAGDNTYQGSNDAAWLGIKYNFQGFMPPMNADGTSVFKNGRVVPFKIRIFDATMMPGTAPNATPQIGVVYLGAGMPPGLDAETPIQGTPDAGYFMRYTGMPDDQYIYNWDLTSLSNGAYKVLVDLGDSKVCGGWRSTIYGSLISIEKKK